ncbi:MAG: RHS repeat-associated core domain-containing protein [Thermoflexales bacterium]
MAAALSTHHIGIGRVAHVTRTLIYVFGDHLGSASLATNASGAVVSQMRYTPGACPERARYCGPRRGELRWTSGVDMPTDFTFTSQRAGPPGYVGSLMDYVARGYSPALGRFVSADTIVPGAGNPQAFNRYMYVLGNPLRLTDPTGHCPKGDAECQKRDKQLETTLGYRPDGVDIWETGDFDAILNLLSKGFMFDGLRWSAHTLNSVASGIEEMVAKYGEKRAYGAMEFGRRGKISLVNKPAGHASGQGGWAYPDERKIELWLTDDDNVKNAWAVVHELGHFVDLNAGGGQYSSYGAEWTSKTGRVGIGLLGIFWFQSAEGQSGATSTYALQNPREDFAESFGRSVFADYALYDANPFNPKNRNIDMNRQQALTTAMDTWK